MKVLLEKPKWPEIKRLHWKTSLPFVENTRGRLIHRPKRVGIFKNTWGMWLGIEFWCGLHINGDRKEGNVTFTADPDKERFICHVCERNAVAAKHPTSDELAGRHVHIGCTKPVKLCCEDIK